MCLLFRQRKLCVFCEDGLESILITADPLAPFETGGGCGLPQFHQQSGDVTLQNGGNRLTKAGGTQVIIAS